MFSVERLLSGAPSNSIAPVERTMLQIARKRGGLAGAVGAEQRGQAALVEREVQPVKRLHLAVKGAQILDVEQHRH